MSIFFFIILFFFPEIFNHSINYVQANPLVTPKHIVPEWYFLPFYAILRSILDKTFGILLMFISMAVLYIFPILDACCIHSKIYNISYTFFFLIFTANFIFLGFLGSQTAEYPCVTLGLCCSLIHIAYCFIYIPLNGSLEMFYINSNIRNRNTALTYPPYL